MKNAWTLIFALIVACGAPEPLTAPVGGGTAGTSEAPRIGGGRLDAHATAPDPAEFVDSAVAPPAADPGPEFDTEEDAGVPPGLPDAALAPEVDEDAGLPRRSCPKALADPTVCAPEGAFCGVQDGVTVCRWCQPQYVGDGVTCTYDPLCQCDTFEICTPDHDCICPPEYVRHPSYGCEWIYQRG